LLPRIRHVAEVQQQLHLITTKGEHPMSQPAPAAPTRRQKLLEKALEEISIGDPEKAETYIELALDEETAAPQLHEALELCEDVLSDLARLDDGTPSISALNLARAALTKAKGGAEACIELALPPDPEA
jgi:hypothetical protein